MTKPRSRPWRKIRKRLWIIPAVALLAWCWPVMTAAPLTVGAILGSLLGLVAWGAHRRPCGPAYGRQTTPSPVSAPTNCAAPERLRVASFNIHSGKGRDESRQLSRVAESLAGVDLAGLQEVRGSTLFPGQDQAALLARMLGLTSIFAPSVRQWWHCDFGGALLTRLPLRDWLRIPLPRTSGKSYQNVLLARCDLGGTTLHVLSAHVEYRCLRQRAEHVEAVLTLFESLAGPVVLLGDLNLGREAPRLVELVARDDVQAVSHGSDWIVTRGLEIQRHGIEDHGASDHACVWADVALAPAQEHAPRKAA